MAMPCNCCPTEDVACAATEILINGNGGLAILVANPPGGATGVYPLDRWSNGDISGGPFTGFNSPGVQWTALTSPTIDLVFPTPQSRLRGLREWNQGGGDLFDGDGFASWDVTFMAPGLVPILTVNMIMANGAAPFTLLLPGSQTVDNVDRIRLTNMRKVNPGAGVAPLVREVRALQINPVFSCRPATGGLQWYDPAGNLVPNADVIPCT